MLTLCRPAFVCVVCVLSKLVSAVKSSHSQRRMSALMCKEVQDPANIFTTALCSSPLSSSSSSVGGGHDDDNEAVIFLIWVRKVTKSQAKVRNTASQLETKESCQRPHSSELTHEARTYTQSLFIYRALCFSLCFFFLNTPCPFPAFAVLALALSFLISSAHYAPAFTY